MAPLLIAGVLTGEDDRAAVVAFLDKVDEAKMGRNWCSLPVAEQLHDLMHKILCDRLCRELEVCWEFGLF